MKVSCCFYAKILKSLNDKLLWWEYRTCAIKNVPFYKIRY